MKSRKQTKTKTKKTCYVIKKRTPNLQEPGTVPPIGPLAHQLWFFGVKKGQLVPNMGKHGAKQELETVPPQELGIVPPQWSKKRPLRWYCF